MIRTLGIFAWLALLAVAPDTAWAGYFELAAGFSFNQSNYGDGSFEWTRRWSASLGYHLTNTTEFEVEFQDVVDRTLIPAYQDTTFDDQMFSIDWVQSLFGRSAPVDPFFKLGVGQFDHVATGTYDVLGGASANTVVDSFTEILGAGLRIGISKRFSVRVEGDTYLTNFSLASWQDNCYFMVGLSFFF